MKAFDSIRSWSQRARKQRQIWAGIPLTSKLMLLAMVFCLFAGIGAVSQLQSATASFPKLWAAALFTGLLAVGYAWAGTRGDWFWFIVLLPLQILTTPILFSYVVRHTAPAPAIPETIRPWLEAGSGASILFMSVAYALTMSFISREGERFFRTHTEMQLAGEIHQSLVSPIQRRIGDYEFFAASLASGVVGGDLVDVIERDGYWLAYVADVAGHGVSSGVLMAMIKSSATMSMRFDLASNGLLDGLNEVLLSLKTGNMFATCGLLAYSPAHGLRYSLAGHLPVLRCRDGRIEHLAAQNMPVGLFPDMPFASDAIASEKGDLLVIVTDGLTEVFNKAGEELGLDAIAAILVAQPHDPLEQIAAEIFRYADRHGLRADDQSLLLVRKVN